MIVARRTLNWRSCLALLLVAICIPTPAHGYAVLSHEEVVDMAWTGQLLPLLKQRFPGLTDDQIREAHAYAYGGSVIQDIGYYPFGDKQFSDLLHYVRTGDFVSALLRDASTPDELAFALGALAHYYGDTIGHPTVNAVTAEEYPQLRHRFGHIVTYAEDPTAHLRTEFGFDVAEVAHGHYSQQDYRDFIGFQVAKPLLEHAFLETYGLPMSDVMKHEDLAISTYRYAVSKLIPQMTHVALASYHDQIASATPGFDKRKFLYRMRRTEFQKDYGKQYQHPSFGARFVAALLTIVPKIGPFKALQLKVPNADEQAQYLHSINAAEDAYQKTVTNMIPSVAEPPTLADTDFDTGKPTAEGEYPLADRTYAYLVQQLTIRTPSPQQPGTQQAAALQAAAQKSAPPPPALLSNIETFYANPSAPDDARKDAKKWAAVQSGLAILRQTQVSPAQAVAPPAKIAGQ